MVRELPAAGIPGEEEVGYHDKERLARRMASAEKVLPTAILGLF